MTSLFGFHVGKETICTQYTACCMYFNSLVHLDTSHKINQVSVIDVHIFC